jgi:hypothetical protein
LKRLLLDGNYISCAVTGAAEYIFSNTRSSFYQDDDDDVNDDDDDDAAAAGKRHGL